MSKTDFHVTRWHAESFLLDHEEWKGTPLDMDLKVQVLRYVEWLHLEGVLKVRDRAPTLTMASNYTHVTFHWPDPGPDLLKIIITEEGPVGCLVQGLPSLYVEEDLLILLRGLNKTGQSS